MKASQATVGPSKRTGYAIQFALLLGVWVGVESFIRKEQIGFRILRGVLFAALFLVAESILGMMSRRLGSKTTNLGSSDESANRSSPPR